MIREKRQRSGSTNSRGSFSGMQSNSILRRSSRFDVKRDNSDCNSDYSETYEEKSVTRSSLSPAQRAIFEKIHRPSPSSVIKASLKTKLTKDFKS